MKSIGSFPFKKSQQVKGNIALAFTNLAAQKFERNLRDTDKIIQKSW